MDKQRKSKAQEIYEQADNAGRFAGNDTDAQAAREQAKENVRQDTNSTRSERNKDNNEERERDTRQSKDYSGEAQNVNDDAGRPLNPDEVENARNKSMEGIRQGREETNS